MNKIVNGVANDYEFDMPTGVSHIAYFRTDGGSPRLYTEEYVEEKDKEIERLNNIINELEKYIVEEIDDAQEELNLILQGNDLDYKNECTKEFNCIKNALDVLLDKLKELKEGR